MRISLSVCAIATALIAAPATALDAAQDAPEASPAEELVAIDPARLDAARRVVAVALPEGEAATMLAALAGSAFDQQIAQLTNDTEFKQSMRENPALRDRMERYIADMRGLAETVMVEAAPQMSGAIAEFYARHYSIAELEEIERFLNTPTGQRYARDGFIIMQDPAIARWQQSIDRQIEASATPILETFIEDITRLATKGTQ